MDLGVLLLMGLTAALARGTSSLGTDISRSSRVQVEEQAEITVTSEVKMYDHPGQLSQEVACPACTAPRPPKRARRCTCYSYKDKECIYYCHLDIIWINTPERTLPYGMSSYRGLQRIRRSNGVTTSNRQCLQLQRCSCTDPADSECSRFCKARLNTLSQAPHTS